MRLVAQVVLSTTLAFVGACGASDAPITPPTEASVIGVYNMTIVNGGSLPFPFSYTDSSRTYIVGGRITLTADHKFTDTYTWRVVLLAGGSPPDQSDTLDGTWSLASNSLTLNYYVGHVRLAIVRGNLITVNDQGLFLTYSK
jgi:hypothetical protein